MLIPYSGLNFPKIHQLEKINPEAGISLPHHSAEVQLLCSETKTSYIEKVKRLQRRIQLGDIYEINFCVEFFAENISINPFKTHALIEQHSGAPFSALAKHEDTWIISASPERFLKKTGDKLITQPMKGTAPRFLETDKDIASKNQLATSEKERAENCMAVDVARHDLSKIAKKGTVKVEELCGVYTFKTVHQMISTIACELNPETSLEEIIRATFPMASMTGAPKHRAMELIQEYESFDRNFYSGCMGQLDKNGDFDLAVLIRTIFWNEKTKRLSIPVGSAITHYSNPEQEWEECLVKVKFLKDLLGMKLETQD